MTIGDRIRDRRKELRMTLDDVAARTGVPKSTIQRWESGAVSNMGQARLRKVATALDTSVEYLQTDVNITVNYQKRPEILEQDVFDYMCRLSGYRYAAHLGTDRYYSNIHAEHVLASPEAVHTFLEKLAPFFGYLLHERSIPFQDFYRMANEFEKETQEKTVKKLQKENMEKKEGGISGE